MMDVSPQNPDFQPSFPTYPELAQVIRASAPSIGSNVYPGFVQQLLPPLTLRDRESCYLIEPNGVVLGPGYYDARLVGSYLSLPLYATTCCPTGSLSSSSSSTSPAAILRTALGFDQASGVTSLTLPQVTVLAGSLLVVVGSVAGVGLQTLSCKFGATSLTSDASKALPGGSSVAGSLAILSGAVSGTQDIVLTLSGVVAASMTIQAIQVSNLASNVLDKLVTASGTSSAADTGATPTTTVANEYAQGAFLLVTPGGTFTWKNSFTAGGQDVDETIGGTTVIATEGYRILSATGTVNALLGGVTPAAWAGVVTTYR